MNRKNINKKRAKNSNPGEAVIICVWNWRLFNKGGQSLLSTAYLRRRIRSKLLEWVEDYSRSQPNPDDFCYNKLPKERSTDSIDSARRFFVKSARSSGCLIGKMTSTGESRCSSIPHTPAFIDQKKRNRKPSDDWHIRLWSNIGMDRILSRYSWAHAAAHNLIIVIMQIISVFRNWKWIFQTNSNTIKNQTQFIEAK